MNMGWYHQQMKIVFHKSFGLSYTWHDKLVFWVTNLPKIFIHALKMSVSISRKRDFHLIMFFFPHLDILNNNKRIQVQSNNNKCLFIDLFFFFSQYCNKFNTKIYFCYVILTKSSVYYGENHYMRRKILELTHCTKNQSAWNRGFLAKESLNHLWRTLDYFDFWVFIY